MDLKSTFELLLYGGGALVIPAWYFWQFRRAESAKKWPRTQATIESGAYEEYSLGRGGKATLPTFAFSYKVGEEFYGGRFALLPYITDPPPSIVEKLIGQTLEISYEPGRPQNSFIPNDLIEGCKVEQKIGPHVVYPHD